MYVRQLLLNLISLRFNVLGTYLCLYSSPLSFYHDLKEVEKWCLGSTGDGIYMYVHLCYMYKQQNDMDETKLSWTVHKERTCKTRRWWSCSLVPRSAHSKFGFWFKELRWIDKKSGALLYKELEVF